MRYIKLACICLAVVLTGCASGVKYKDMATSISTVPPDQGRVYFYRDSIVGMALQPAVVLDGAAVGVSKANGFFYVDTTPGDHLVSTRTEVERELTFTLDAGETKYVRTAVTMGLFVGHITPELVSQDEAFKALPGLSYTGTAAPVKAIAASKPVQPEFVAPAPVNPAPQPAEPKPAAVQLYAVTDNAPAQAAAPTTAPAPAPAPMLVPVSAPTRVLAPAVVTARPVAAIAQPAANVPFQLGTSSSTVEKMGKQSGCDSKQGAGLISDSGPVEKYQMTCQNGTVYLAQCEFRQCTQVMQ